jgi:hypothetical protein
MTSKQLLHKISWRVPWRGRPRSLSRSASASRSTATCRPSSDPHPVLHDPREERARHRAQCCGSLAALGASRVRKLALPSRLMASARFCLTLLLTPDLRAQTQAAAFTAARRPARRSDCTWPTPRLLLWPVRSPMMPIWLNFAELFDVDVDQLAGMLALVASHRLGRLKRAEPIETQPTKDAAHRRRRDGKLPGDLLAGVRCRRKASTAARVAGGVCSGEVAKSGRADPRCPHRGSVRPTWRPSSA